ncbi:MAG: FIVAR domain-containing protein [Clostridiales Family XIII bacterium]|jgi:hypothetical protein|nr:FIVAR domain-containing protein [Clostridiales Family XIII bacterium]
MNCKTKGRWSGKLLAVLLSAMLTLTLMPAHAVQSSSGGAEDTLRVILDFEGYNIGQGFYIEPTQLEVAPGTTVGQAMETLLAREGHSYVGGHAANYLASVAGFDTGTINVPSYITDADGGPTTEDAVAVGNPDNHLGTGDYGTMSGWMSTVNHGMGDDGIGQQVLQDGDVVRFQFTLWGYGADLGIPSDWFTPFYTHADKTELIRALFAPEADVAGALAALKPAEPPASTADKSALSAGIAQAEALDEAGYTPDSWTALQAALEAARTVAKNVNASQTETDAALAALQTAVNALRAYVPAPAAATVKSALDATLAYQLAKDADPGFGSEWRVLGLARAASLPADAGGNLSADAAGNVYAFASAAPAAGKYLPGDIRSRYFENLLAVVAEKEGNLSASKYTEYSRVILALSALGADATDVGGYDLTERLAHFDKVTNQGINGPIYALLALDSNHYAIPVIADTGNQATRARYIEYILDKEIQKGSSEAGGFALYGSTPDPDITAMALQALAPYYKGGDAAVIGAVDRALSKLSGIQTTDGGFKSWGSVNAESIAQVVVALNALGVSVDDARFVKTGKTVYDALMRFAIDGGKGGFSHTIGGAANGMATEQASYALVAQYRASVGAPGLYEMADSFAYAADRKGDWYAGNDEEDDNGGNDNTGNNNGGNNNGGNNNGGNNGNGNNGNNTGNNGNSNNGGNNNTGNNTGNSNNGGNSIVGNSAVGNNNSGGVRVVTQTGGGTNTGGTNTGAADAGAAESAADAGVAVALADEKTPETAIPPGSERIAGTETPLASGDTDESAGGSGMKTIIGLIAAAFAALITVVLGMRAYRTRREKKSAA